MGTHTIFVYFKFRCSFFWQWASILCILDPLKRQKALWANYNVAVFKAMRSAQKRFKQSTETAALCSLWLGLWQTRSCFCHRFWICYTKKKLNKIKQHVTANALHTKTRTITFTNNVCPSMSLSQTQHYKWHYTPGHISLKYDLRWLKAFWFKSVFS